MSKLVIAKRCLDLPEAIVARSLLDFHGYPVFLFDTAYIGVQWHKLQAIGGLRLMVLEEDLDDAKELLGTGDDALSDGGVDTCPACGAGHVFRHASILSPLVTLGLFLAYAVAVPFLLRGRNRLCLECGHKWKIERE